MDVLSILIKYVEKAKMLTPSGPALGFLDISPENQDLHTQTYIMLLTATFLLYKVLL